MAAPTPVFLGTNNKKGEGWGLGSWRPVGARSNAMNSYTFRGPRGDREQEPSPRPAPVPGFTPRRKSSVSIQVYNVPYPGRWPRNSAIGAAGV